jgi:hypothetical protein
MHREFRYQALSEQAAQWVQWRARPHANEL